MQLDAPLPAPAAPADATAAPWYRLLNGYHWFVLVVASLGWLFDTMDQQLFNLARIPAVTELMRLTPGAPGVAAKVGPVAANTTSIFLIGWATGGFIFGILGDRIGRARTMLITILMYSCFTGLSALARDVNAFSAFRFLTGLGVGGEFAVGVALVAEVMPERARANALGLLQSLATVGNMMAAVIGIGLGLLEQSGRIGSSWRPMFLVGVLPALLAIPIMLRLEEPAKWKAAIAEKHRKRLGGETADPGPLVELFTTPRWRYNTFVGMALAFAGVVGLWGIGVFSADLVNGVLRADVSKQAAAQGLDGRAASAFVDGRLTIWRGVTLFLFNLGGFFGVTAFTRFTASVGRRKAFAVAFVLAMASTAFAFRYLAEVSHIFWMIPLMGFSQMTLFGGYAIYLPELFPTRLRSTGTSFCYNVGRLVAAAGPLLQGYLIKEVFKDAPQPLRYAGVAMCGAFVIGLLALPFAPETKGQPLPE